MSENRNEIRILRTLRSKLESQELDHWEKGENEVAEHLALQVFHTSLEIKRILYVKESTEGEVEASTQSKSSSTSG